MSNIPLKDNNLGKVLIENKYIDSLNKIANKTIKELIKKHPDLLIFPDSFNSNNEDIEKDKIFSIFSDNKLQTFNIMGFIGIDNISITIGSRFDTNENKQYFLQYMLSKVFAINLVNFNNTASNENIWDFLLFFIFASHLNKAIRQGVYKEYKKKKYNNSNVKGAIDIARHIKTNRPFVGNISYNTKEFSYNNSIIQLIRHTIEYITSKGFLNALNNNSETLKSIRLIKEITPNYNKTNRLSTIQDNIQINKHPYYTEYEPLRKICLKILNREGLSYKDTNEKVHGVLFDGAWLWEEYLNTLLRQLNFIHPENKTRKNKLHLFSNNNGYKRYPDFYKPDKTIIIDAKYKHLNFVNIDRNDIHQIISYLYILEAQKAYLLYPLKEKNEIVQVGTLNGYKGEVNKYGFKIPDNTDNFIEFSKIMKKNEDKLIEAFNNK